MIKKPLAVGLKVCSKAVFDNKTRSVTLVECIRRLYATKLPAKAPTLSAFVSVTDGFGRCQFEIVVSHLSTAREVAAQKWKANFTDPLKERWFLVPLGAFKIPILGRYEVVLFADGDWVTRSVIDVIGDRK